MQKTEDINVREHIEIRREPILVKAGLIPPYDRKARRTRRYRPPGTESSETLDEFYLIIRHQSDAYKAMVMTLEEFTGGNKAIPT